LINAAGYTRVLFSPDATQDGRYLLYGMAMCERGVNKGGRIILTFYVGVG